MVHLILFFVHGVDASSGPELQQSLEQQSTQVHYKDEGTNKVSSNAIYGQLQFCIIKQLFVYKMGLGQISYTLGRIHQSLKTQRPLQTPRQRSSRSHPM